MKYIVEVPELHYQTFAVKAVSFADAALKVSEGEGELVEGNLEYSHTLPLEWEVLNGPNGVEVIPSWTVNILKEPTE